MPIGINDKNRKRIEKGSKKDRKRIEKGLDWIVDPFLKRVKVSDRIADPFLTKGSGSNHRSEIKGSSNTLAKVNFY